MEAYKLYKVDHYNFNKGEEYFLNLEDAKSTLRKIISQENKRFVKPEEEEINKILSIQFNGKEIIDRGANIIAFKPEKENIVLQYRNFYCIRNKKDARRIVNSEYIIDMITIPEADIKDIQNNNYMILRLCRYNELNQINLEKYYINMPSAISELKKIINEECNNNNIPSSKDVQDYIQYNLNGAKIIHNANSLIGFEPLLSTTKIQYRNFYYKINNIQQREMNYSEYLIKEIQLKNTI